MRKSLLVSQIVFLLLTPVLLQLLDYLHPIVLAVIWLCYSFLSLYMIFLFSRKTIQFSAPFFHSIMFVYSLGLLILLFFRPENQQYGDVSLIPFATIRYYFSGQVDFLIAFYNLAANIGLFIPYGVYYRYFSHNPSPIRLMIITVVSIIIIEGLQFFTKRGSFDIDDLLLNVLGVLLGYILSPIVRRVFVIKKGH